MRTHPTSIRMSAETIHRISMIKALKGWGSERCQSRIIELAVKAYLEQLTKDAE